MAQSFFMVHLVLKEGLGVHQIPIIVRLGLLGYTCLRDQNLWVIREDPTP